MVVSNKIAEKLKEQLDTSAFNFMPKKKKENKMMFEEGLDTIECYFCGKEVLTEIAVPGKMKLGKEDTTRIPVCPECSTHRLN